MTLITWFEVHYTKFLPPPLKAINGLLVVADIALLAIVLSHNFQDTILMLRTIGFVVKIMKEEHKVFDIFLQCSNAPAFSVFIELSDFFLR
jgi:hypothetical protein